MTNGISRYKVLSAGIFSLILTMGVARFSYTPLLPLMQKQAGLGLAEGGWLAAINYIGYLTGAVVASLINDLVIKDRLYRIGMVIAVMSTAMMGVASNMVVWMISRYIAGITSAAGMLLGTGLILNWLIRHDFRSELGIHFSGVGLGIAASAVAVELMNRWGLDWQAQWYVFTAMGAILLIPALAWLPPPDRSVVSQSGRKMDDTPPKPLFLRLFMAYYFCAGVGYVVTATFIVAIVDHLPGLADRGAWVFLFIGLGSAPACIIWDLIARRTGDLNALILASALQIVGILVPVLQDGLIIVLCGSVLFGASTMGIVGLVLTMAGRFYPTRPAKMMGKMTLSYGIAQVVAPAVTGQLARSFGGYQGGLYLAAGVMIIGTLLLVALQTIEIRANARANSIQLVRLARHGKSQ